jgi:hypothetical protein
MMKLSQTPNETPFDTIVLQQPKRGLKSKEGRQRKSKLKLMRHWSAPIHNLL